MRSALFICVLILLSIASKSKDFSNQPSGACCIDHHHEYTECVEVPTDFCEGKLHGEYAGDFTRCRGIEDTCIGACCTDHGCIEVTKSECDEHLGGWARATIRCPNVSNVCGDENKKTIVKGACCFKVDDNATDDFGSCRRETFWECYAGVHHPRGEFWTDDTYCDMAGICPFLFVPFVQELPIPPVLKPVHGKSGCEGVEDGDYKQIYSPTRGPGHSKAEYHVKAEQCSHLFYPHLPNPQLVFGYNGIYPGPTIETCVGVPIHLEYFNYIPKHRHPLGFDSCPHGANFLPDLAYTSVHLHGGATASKYDGWPDAVVYPGEEYSYYYDNIRHCTTLAYHDHALGIARKNIYMGLLGLYLIREPEHKTPKLPEGKFEIPLIIQDRSFKWSEDGFVELYYPEFTNVTVPFGGDDFTGTVPVVNGAVLPFLKVCRGKYRFRIINASNARTWSLSFVKVEKSGYQVDVEFDVIGGDQSLLHKPVHARYVMLGPFERADIVFDFEDFKKGDKLWLVNTAAIPFPFGAPRPHRFHFRDIDNEYPLQGVMEIQVDDDDEGFTDEVPDVLFPDFEKLPAHHASQLRSFLLIQNITHGDADDHPKHSDSDDHHKEPLGCPPSPWVIKRFKKDGSPSHGFLPGWWDVKTSILEEFFPLKNSIEIWEFWNPGTEAHPIHIHLVAFQVLSIRAIKWDLHKEETMYPTHDLEIEPTELAWKDTIKVEPFTVTSVIMKFSQHQGKYPLHCHILEHEDDEMMRQFRVIDPHEPCQLRSGSICGNRICEAGNGENCENCPHDCIGGEDFCCGWKEPSLPLHHGIVVLPAKDVKHTAKDYIGCGPEYQLHHGELRKCQYFLEGSRHLLSRTCREDFIESCCGDDWCEWEKGETEHNCHRDCH